MYAAGDLRVEDVPDPVIRAPADAIVRVVRAAICGSDLIAPGGEYDHERDPE